MEKSANTMDCSDSLFALGKQYLSLEGNSFSAKDAFLCFKESAKQGHAQAQYELSQCYLNGIGVEKDDTKYLECLIEARKLDSNAAWYELSEIIFAGSKANSNDQFNFKNAILHLKTAAEKGHLEAQYEYAVLLEKGKVFDDSTTITSNPEEAMYWLAQAAEEGHSKATLKIIQLRSESAEEEDDTVLPRSRMSSEQLAADFGTFPPAPLECLHFKDNKFAIERYGFKSKLKVKLANLFRVFPALKIFMKQEVPKFLGQFKDAWNKLSKDTQTNSATVFLHKSLFLLLLLASSPIILMLAAIAITRLFFKSFLHSRSSDSFFGLHNAFRKGVVTINNRGRNIAPILSHEHIHLLQSEKLYQQADTLAAHVDTEFVSKASARRDFLPLVAEEHAQFDSTSYLHTLCELEARFHEVIISIFRADAALPTTYTDALNSFLRVDFVIAASASSTKLQELYSDYPTEDHNIVHTRCQHTASDLLWVLNSLSNDKSKVAFILEVMPMIYTSLLHLYGEQDVADVIQSAIPMPSIYDRYACDQSQRDMSIAWSSSPS